jgi:hypothetical protein
MRVGLSLVALSLAAFASLAGAQPAPYRHWQTLDTPHFHVHAPVELEREGRVAGAAAERAYAMLSRELVAPRGPIDLVVSDDADYSNGSATPYPTNRIVIFATPPIEAGGLRLNADWIQLVITHELTHIFHLDRTRGIWAVGQSVFGRAAPLFPNIYSPSWLTEGLAVYYESRFTEGGRLRGAEQRDYARAAALEGRLPGLNDLSLSTPRFPGGDAAYGYGALLMEYLSRTRGDSSIPHFVELQSSAWIPLFQARAARRAFDETFTDAFDAFRDSVRKSVSPAERLAPAFTDLTPGGYYALNPRWLDDSTIVYSGTDGRESRAAYTVTTGGVRRRLGRRSSLGANSPLPGGGVLFAQPDYVGTEEVRSDLYTERDGVVTRLTRGARLIQPDVSGDGNIVAVERGAARSSLVLLDASGNGRRVLRAGGADETWSEPRWSPDGVRLVAIHRVHGGEQLLEKIDVATGESCVMVRDRALIASPSWASTRVIIYTSERTGAPQVETTTHCGDHPGTGAGTPVGIVSVEPNARHQALNRNVPIAVVTLHADGYHVGVGSRRIDAGPQSGEAIIVAVDTIVHVDSQPLAAGAYHDYSAARSLVPRYWLPVIESSPGGGTRFGALTSAQDVVGRHAYAAYVALETSGRFSTGALSYRYAGLERPLIDVDISQDWTGEGRLVDSGGASLGSLLKRTQDASIAATWVRPRCRSYSSFTAGLGLERRRFATDPSAVLARLDPIYAGSYAYPRAFVGGVWSNTQRPPRSISPEDGLTLAFTARERLRTDVASRTVSGTVVGTAAGYRSLELPGFAHHVLALRLAGGYADARTASSLEVGGTSSSALDLAPGVSVGEGRRTFGVRGFPTASVYGTRAEAASLEYRAPLALGGVGLRNLPLFFDRASASLFADAGRASCAAAPLYAGICSPAPVIGTTIASVGAEVGLSVAILQIDAPELLRVGVAVPVAGRDVVNAHVEHVSPASVYVAFGLSF